MLEKGEKQVREECSRPQRTAAAEAQSPSILEGVPLGGVVILNIRIPCEKMTIINDIRIKDHYVHNLPENRELLAYARENRRAGNMAEIAFWKQVHKKMFHGLDFDRLKVIENYIVDNYEHEIYENKE